VHAPLLERLVRAAVLDRHASILVLRHRVFPSIGSVTHAGMRFPAFRGEVRSAVGDQKLAKLTGNLQDTPQWMRKEFARLSRFWGCTRITPRPGLSISATRKSEIARKIGRIQNGNTLLSCAR
jgi:hypothetical protein